MKIYILFGLLLFSLKTLADCSPKVMKSCVKMNLLSAKFSFFSSLVRFKSMCEVEYEEVESKTKWTALVRHCPEHTKESQYVYILYSCSESVLERAYDQLEVWQEGECVSILGDEAESVKTLRKFKKIPVGTELIDLKKMGLYRVAMDGDTWTYHAHPGYSVKINVEKNNCEGEACSEENGKTVKEIVSISADLFH